MIDGKTVGLLSFLSVLFPEDREESAKDPCRAEHTDEKLDWTEFGQSNYSLRECSRRSLTHQLLKSRSLGSSKPFSWIGVFLAT